MRAISSIKNVQDLNATLQQLSHKSDFSSGNIEIRIQRFQTYLKNPKDGFYEIMSNEKLDDDAFFDDKSNDFKQVFDIEIFKIDGSEGFFLRESGNFQRLDLVIEDSFNFPKDEEELDIFLQKINAHKAKQGVILRNSSKQKAHIYEQLQNLSAKILQDKTQQKQNHTIILESAPFYIQSKQSRLECKFSDFDISKKNYIFVSENNLIAEFHFAQNGKNGKNLKGDFIINETPPAAPPTIMDKIKQQQDIGGIKYFSTESGIVIFENNAFNFTKEVQLSNVQIKDNLNFIGEIESEGKLTISTDKEVNDALQSGVCLRGSNIVINGNIGANTKIEAQNLKITGQTHKMSQLNATNADVNVHKGHLSATKAKVMNFEGGSLDCDEVEILNLNGGIVECFKANVRNLFSHSTLRFSKECVIDTLRGGGNKITFSTAVPNAQKRPLQLLCQKLESIQAHLHLVQKKLEASIYQKNKFQDTAEKLKQTIEKHKAKGENPPPYVAQNYNAFLQILTNIKELKRQVLEIANDEKATKEQIEERQKIIKDAKLTCHKGWEKYNDIVYELTLPQKRIAKNIINGVGKYYIENDDIHAEQTLNQDINIKNQGF